MIRRASMEDRKGLVSHGGEPKESDSEDSVHSKLDLYVEPEDKSLSENGSVAVSSAVDAYPIPAKPASTDDINAIHDNIKLIDKKSIKLRHRKPKKQESGSVGYFHSESDKPAHIYKSKFGDLQLFLKTTSIFDADYFKNSDFYGIYISFWLGTGFLMFRTFVTAIMDTEVPFGWESPIGKLLLKDLWKIALTDLFMYLTSWSVFFIQLLVLKTKSITWDGLAKKINPWVEIAHVFGWVLFAINSGYPWIGKVFLVLHEFVLLMKMHSYAYYNGYLWDIFGELSFSKDILARLDSKDPKKKVSIPKDSSEEEVRRVLKGSIKFCEYELDSQSVVGISTLKNQDFVQTVQFKYVDVEAAEFSVNFPSNITFKNYFMYTMYPTLVYTLNFPRLKKIRWKFVFEKTCAIFGVIFLMVLVANRYLYPICVRAVNARNLPVEQRFTEYVLVLLDMIPPFMAEYIFTFFLIWDFILNDIAELSRYADRDFYGPWWSCTTWAEFARIWNVPVHNFLLRHVYHSSVSALDFKKAQAQLATFLLSSVIHELVMFVIFQKFRGYLFFLQMSQLPLVMLSNTKFMKGKKVLGNVICWVGFVSGPPLICTLYLMF